MTILTEEVKSALEKACKNAARGRDSDVTIGKVQVISSDSAIIVVVYGAQGDEFDQLLALCKTFGKAKEVQGEGDAETIVLYLTEPS